MDGLKNLMGALKATRIQMQGSEKSSNFDDLLNEEGKEDIKRVAAICIRSGYIMDAIGIMDKEEKKYLHGNSGGGDLTIISLKDDAIKEIRGDMDIYFKGSAISNVTIEMKSGKTYGPFGTGKSGKAFCLTIPEKTEFVGFYGNADGNIVKSLGLICCEGSEDVLKKLTGSMAGNKFPGLGS